MATTQENAPIDPALTSFDTLPDAAHIRVHTLAALYGVSIATVWRWARAGRIPAPIRRVGVTAWKVGDLRRSMSPAQG